jgi:hypothetical protein
MHLFRNMHLIAMKKILFLIAIAFIGIRIFSQEMVLCADDILRGAPVKIVGSDNSCRFADNEYAFRKVEKLMTTVNLPMNFMVCRRAKMKNAYAVIDSAGNRFIVYDYDFLQKLDGDKNDVVSTTILAHEIGHHLAAHTVSFEWADYIHERDRFCNTSSIEYDKRKCSIAQWDLNKFSRQQELEADRFAGFIMYRYGASLEQVLNAYRAFTHNYDDRNSTHPTLNTRLDSVQSGFFYAKSLGSNTAVVDLEDIKGGKIPVIVPFTTRIQRNSLLLKLRDFAVFQCMYDVQASSNHRFLNSWEELNYPETESLSKYFGKDMAYSHIVSDSTNEYFEPYKLSGRMIDDERIGFSVAVGMHIKDNLLRLMIITPDEKPKIVYSCPFEESKIGFSEIKAIFTPYYKRVLQKEIDKVTKGESPVKAANN